MRQALASRKDQVLKNMVATVGKYGSGVGGLGAFHKSLLLLDVVKNGELLADHVWVDVPGPLDLLGVYMGDRILFDARVVSYNRGISFRKEKKDYKLADLANVRRVTA